MDLRYGNLRILIELTPGNELDVAQFLVKEQTVELARTEPSADQPVVSAARFTIAKAYNDLRTSEFFDPEVNSRFRAGSKVTIQIYFNGAWRSPPFAATTYIKTCIVEDAGTHELAEIETQGKLGQVIEEDKEFDPERKFDSLGNAVADTRDVLGIDRTLRDIVNSYLYVKGVGPVIDASGFMTQSTATYKEYLRDTSDSEINAAQQMVWYNVDRANEINFLYETQSGQTSVSAIPVTLAAITPARKLFDATWGLYTENLITYKPEKNIPQFAEYLFISGVSSTAKQRPSVTTEGGMPRNSNSFSFNVPVNPITDTLTTTTIDWTGLTIETEAITYSTAQAIKVQKGASAGFGNIIVQREVTKKEFDARKRKIRETIKRYVPEGIKQGTDTPKRPGDPTTTIAASTIGTPAYQKETLYNLSNTDKVLQEITHETASNAITGLEGALDELGIFQSKGRYFTQLKEAVNIASGGAVMGSSIAQGGVPYLPSSFAGADENANAPQCEYMPEQWYVESKPLWRKVQITWGTGTRTGRTKNVDVGSSLLTGANFDLLANSLAHWWTSRHTQYNCSFPMTTALFTDWQIPGKVVTVTKPQKGVKSYYWTGADSIKISEDSIIGETTLFLIATETVATGAVSAPVPVVETFYLLDEDSNILTDEDGNRLVWS